MNHNNKQEWLAAGLGVVLVFCLLNFDLIALLRLFKWDAWDQFWPQFDVLSQSLRQGRIPLWDLRPCCGFPFHADPQTGTFYPIGALVGLIFGDGYRVFQYFWLLHWLGAILGFFRLIKHMGISPGGAFVGSVLFGFCGFFVGGGQHTGCIITICYVVWVLLLMDWALERHFLYALPAGVLFGFAGLGGYPGLTVYSSLAICAWTLLKHKPRLKVFAALAVTFGVAFLVLAPPYVSFAVECRGYTDRTGALPVQVATNVNRFPFSALISLVAPTLTSTYPNLFGATPGEAPLLNGYFGILGIASLCLVILDRRFRKQWSWLLWFMLLVFLFALGSVGGLSVIGYYVFPPLGFVRHTSWSKVFCMMGGAIIAAFVFDRLTSTDETDRNKNISRLLRILAVLLYVVLCALFAGRLIPGEGIKFGFPDTVTPLPNSFHLALWCTGPQLLLIVLFAGVLWAMIMRAIPGKTVMAMLMALVVLDAENHVYFNKDMMSWNGDARETAASLEFMGEASRGMPLDPHNKGLNPPVFNLSSWVFDGKSYVRTYLATTSVSYDFLVGSTWPPHHDTKFLHVLEKTPGFWLVPSLQYCPENDKKVLELLRDTEVGKPLPVFVHDPDAADTTGGSGPVKPGAFGTVEIKRYDHEYVELLVDAPQDCRLFATERYAPGWKAYCDGRQIPLYKSNFCFRACRVPAGKHTIRMEYEPWIYKPLMAISWSLSFVILGGWLLVGLLRWGRSKRRSPGEAEVAAQ